MIRLRAILIALAGALLVAAMWATNPDYNSAIKPFVTNVRFGETGRTRLIQARFDGWHTTDRIAFSLYGSDRLRDSEGVFLIVDLTVTGTTTSAVLDGFWIGSSGRRYAATRRANGIPRLLREVALQPGLDSRAMVVFELPPDEIAGGALSLTLLLDPMLDGTLRLIPPDTPPLHSPEERFGG